MFWQKKKIQFFYEFLVIFDFLGKWLLKEVKKRMKANIEALLKSADQFAEEAESSGKVTLTSKSNAMRRSAKEKEGELKSIEEAIDKKLEALKKLVLVS